MPHSSARGHLRPRPFYAARPSAVEGELTFIRAAQRAVEGAGHAEALEGEGLVQAFAQGRGRARVRAVEAGGELQEAALGEGGVRERVGFVEHAADAWPHGVREMLEDVAALVHLAPLDDRCGATRLADRLAEAGPAVDDEEHRALEVETPVVQVGQEALADGRVLGRPLAQAEDVLLALGIHAQREQDDMVAEVEAVEKDDADIEVGERAAEPRRELRARERDESARDAALRHRALPRPGGQRIEGPVVLAGRDPDRDRLERARVERIAAGGIGEARQRELVPVDAPGPQPGHEDAAAAERDFPARAAAAHGAPRGGGDVLRPTELLAILLHHRAEHLLAGVETEPEERGARLREDVEQWQRYLHRGQGWGCQAFPSHRSCASLLHRRLPSEGCGDHRPTGRQKEPPLLFQPVSSTSAGTPPDAKKRGKSNGEALLWAILTFALLIVGLPLWLVSRPALPGERPPDCPRHLESPNSVSTAANTDPPPVVVPVPMLERASPEGQWA
jgi:hypothetical protein